MQYYESKQIVYVNSRDRVSGTDENFTIQLEIDRTGNFDRVTMLDCAIPKSYYLVQTGKNTFTLDEDGTEVTVTISIGNYSRPSLASTIETALNDVSPNGLTYVVSYLKIGSTVDTGKYTFSVADSSPPPAFNPKFIFGSFLWEPLGFDKDSTNTFSGNVLTSTNVINLNQELTLFIHSDICQSPNDNVLQNIDVLSVESYGHVVFQNPTPMEYSKRITTSNSNQYRFTLTDESFDIISLNGQNMIFTLMLYKESDLNTIWKSFIKLRTLQIKNDSKAQAGGGLFDSEYSESDEEDNKERPSIIRV